MVEPERVGVVFVRRSGGFAGLVTDGQVDLATDPVGAETAALLSQVDFDRLAKTPPQPDRFIYTIRTDDREVRIHEQDLTPELARLVELVLGAGDR